MKIQNYCTKRYYLAILPISSVIFLLVFLSTHGCQSNQKKFYDEVEKIWVGKQLMLPDSLGPDIQGQGLEIANLNESKIKVVAFINADCSKCVLELESWGKALRLISSNRKVVFYVIAFGSSRPMLDYFANDVAGFSYPIFFDKKNIFFTTNNLPNSKEYQAFLLNEHNEILVIGSPIINPTFIKKYQKALKLYSL